MDTQKNLDPWELAYIANKDHYTKDQINEMTFEELYELLDQE